MPYKRLSHFKLIAFLFIVKLSFFNLTSEAAEVQCQKQWGSAIVSSEGNCVITQAPTNEPSSVILRGFIWNYNQQTLALKLKLNHPALLSGLKITFYNRGSVQASYTLPLYTDPQYNILQDGIVTKLSIPLSNLLWEESKMASAKASAQFDSLSIYIATKAQGSVPLQLSLIDYEYITKKTEGRISITFDDGYTSNFKAAQVMQPLGFAGTAYIIPDAIGSKGHLTTKELAQMKSWGWSHSAHLTTPVTQINDLNKVIKEAKEFITKIGSHSSANHFALPLGKYNSIQLDTLKKHFTSVRLAGGFAEGLPITDPFRLKTINVTSDMDPDDVFAWCKKAIDNKDWAILMFHYLDKPEKGELHYSSDKYKALMQKLSIYKKYIKTVEDVISE